MTLSWVDIFIIGCVVISMNWIAEIDMCNKIEQMFEDDGANKESEDKE